MTKKILFSALFFACTFNLKSQDSRESYNIAYEYINDMLSEDIPMSFKNAVFATESAYFDNDMDINSFNDRVASLTNIIKILLNYDVINYTGKDKSEITKHAVIFRVLTDSISIIIDSTTILMHLPCTYDFEDAYGHKDWTKMFVSKLLATGKGNCHSLPYLYKILADELGVKSYIAFAPNHIYIKAYSQAKGWYNTELTSATFPVDAWIIASGYVTTTAIQNGLYMDTLSNKQAVANCLLDLAQGYQRKFGRENPDFVVKCCNTVLQYHPSNVNAMLTKAEAQKTYIQSQMKQKNAKKASDLFGDSEIKSMYIEMEQIYAHLHDSGYRRMPEEMYLQWIELLTTEPEKYIDKDM